MTNSLHIDFETYSDLNIQKVGGIRYSQDCEILMLAYAYNDEEPKLWIPNIPEDPIVYSDLIMQGYIVQHEVPDDLYMYLGSMSITVWAHNADFERAVIQNEGYKYGIPKPHPSRYRCTAALSRAMALPASLAKVTEALDLSEKKR